MKLIVNDKEINVPQGIQDILYDKKSTIPRFRIYGRRVNLMGPSREEAEKLVQYFNEKREGAMVLDKNDPTGRQIICDDILAAQLAYKRYNEIVCYYSGKDETSKFDASYSLSQAARKLEISRMELDLLVENGLLYASENEISGEEIAAFLRRIDTSVQGKNIMDFGTSCNAEAYYFSQIAPVKDKISKIQIWQKREEALRSGNFCVVKTWPTSKYKIELRAGTIYFEYDDGAGFGCAELNCGYAGGGPNTAHDILTDIGVDVELKTVQNMERLLYVKKNGRWISMM